MLASDDTELLREYALRNSETAFATLVSRHLDLVYATALRHVGNHHQAQEIAQAVFIILARKARSLGPKTVLAGWLFQTARLTAANHMRAEIRRAHREQEAYIQSNLSEDSNEDSSAAWHQIIPLLNELVGSLREKERNAIVLRFLQGKEYKEVAAAMGGSEAAAQMRVIRALEKLRGMFAKRGVAVTAVALGGMISACGTQAAPLGMAAKVAATAAQGASLTASTLSLVKGTMNVMAWTKARLAVGASVVALLAVQYHGNSVQTRNLAAARESLSAGKGEFAAQESRITELDQDTALIRETRTSQQEELKRLRASRMSERSTPTTSPAATLLSAELQDPGSREVLHKGLADAARFRLAPLFEALKLEPSDSDKLIQLDADWGLKNLETVAAVAEGRMTADAAAQSAVEAERDNTNQIQLLLGEAGLAKFEECQQTFPARALVQQFNKQLGVFPLNVMQQNALSQLIQAEPVDVTSGLAGDLTVRSLVFPEELSQQFNQEADVNAKLLQEAGTFLAPDQVESLKMMQTANLAPKNETLYECSANYESLANSPAENKMRRSIQILLLTVTGLLIAWQFHRHLSQSRELAAVEAQAAAQRNEMESRRAALAAAQETNGETLEAERHAGNETLLPLMRARAAAAADAAAKTEGMGNAVAKALDSDPSQVERDYQRNQTRANLDLFFKLTKLSPEKADQYVDLETEMRRRQDQRIAGLLKGTLSVADAVSQRDQAYQEQQDQRRELLGPDGWAVLQSVADGMRNGAAKNLTSAVQANMGDNPLNQEQSDRLQGIIKAEVVANTMDDTDLFRPVAEWTQMVTDHEQHVLQAASQFLTPAQQQTLQSLEGENTKQLLQQREQRIKALGIKQ